MNIRRATRRVAVLLCLVGGIIAISPGCKVAAVGGNDYPWQAAGMTGMSPLRFAYRNCTDYVAYELNKQLGGSLNDVRFDWTSINYRANGNASAWTKGAAGKFTVDDIPMVGAVAWWGSERAGGYGHVALVTSVDDETDAITVDEYNTDMAGHFVGGHRLEEDERGWPNRFIHVADTYEDGTYLKTEAGTRYVTAGGAALPVANVPEEAEPITVTQYQVDVMPKVPRDGTYIRDGITEAQYSIRGGALIPTTDWDALGGFWSTGDLAERYLKPVRQSIPLVPAVTVDAMSLAHLPKTTD